MGDHGCLLLFGDGAGPGADHRLLSEHLTAEYRQRWQGRGREVDEWKLRPPRQENHWLYCLVGCAVGASMCGCVLFRHRSESLGAEGPHPCLRTPEERAAVGTGGEEVGTPVGLNQGMLENRRRCYSAANGG